MSTYLLDRVKLLVAALVLISIADLYSDATIALDGPTTPTVWLLINLFLFATIGSVAVLLSNILVFIYSLVVRKAQINTGLVRTVVVMGLGVAFGVSISLLRFGPTQFSQQFIWSGHCIITEDAACPLNLR